MSRCILCGSELSHKEKPEHVLLNALGGRKTTRRKLCGSCNNKAGSGPDSDLAESVVVIRNYANFYSGDGSAPPTIKSIEGDGISFDMKAGGVPSAKISNGLNFGTPKDGKVPVGIQARDIEQLRSYIPHIAKKVGISEESVLKQLANAEPKLYSQPAPTIPSRIPFGAGESQRSIARSCFVLWSLQNKNEDLLSDNYNEIRKYILQDDASPSKLELWIDTRATPKTLLDFCAHPTFIWAGTDSTNTVWGYFRLYGVIGWGFRLSTPNTSSKEAIALISNPEHPESWRCDTATAKLISVDWVKDIPNQSEAEFSSIKQHFAELMSAARDRSINALIEETISDAFSYYNVKDDQVISDEMAREISNYISHRLAHILLRQPHELPINPEKLKAK